MKRFRSAQRGLTLTELIVSVMLVSIVSLAVMALFRTSWLSYQNLVWQSKVNMEARRTLDDICDTLRMAGANADLTSPRLTMQQVTPWNVSGPFRVETFPVGYGSEVSYQVRNRYGQQYLTRQVGQASNRIRLVGQFVTTVEYEYEYRQPAGSENDTAWQSVRVSKPGPSASLGALNNPAAYLAHTVYVTVTSQVSPFGSGGPTYTRRLTSAVHLRGPYNTRTPRAKYVPL